MAQDREWEVRLLFLAEAKEYLDEVESSLLSLSQGGIDRPTLDKMMRAVHSIKGGGAMMGFLPLSEMAHRVEDFFGILKSGRVNQIVTDVERLFLASVDEMRQVIGFHTQGVVVDPAWVETNVAPIFDQLHTHLGTYSAEDNTAALSAETGEDMRSFMFETEVDSCLERLEKVIAEPNSPVLREEFLLASQELGCLGEMLDLSAFTNLCASVTGAIESRPNPSGMREIAESALKQWRRSQALVLIGQFGAMPNQIDGWVGTAPVIPVAPELLIDDSFDELDLLLNLDKPEDEPEDTEAEVELDLDLSLELLDPIIKAPEKAVEFDDLSDLSDFSELNDFGDLTVSTESELNNFNDFDDLGGLDLESLESDRQPSPIADFSNFNDDITDFGSLDDLGEIFGLDPKTSITAEITEEIFETIPKIPEAQKPSPVKTPTKIPAKTPRETAKTTDSDRTIRVPVQQLIRLAELSGELTSERNTLNLQLKQVRNLVELLRRRVRTLEESNSQLRTSYDRVATYVPVTPFLNGSNSIKQPADNFATTYSNTFSDRFDVLEMDRYSDLHIISREIMDNVVQLEEVTSDIETALDEVEGTEREFGRTNKQIQVGVTQVRMRPLSDITGRFPRVIREMSVQYGKQVELKINGGSTLIERTILEALNDPFLHLVRNAFDHGIELPEARIAQGKPATGTIEITADYRGNQTVITIQDDGSGINLDRVRAKALTLGISEADLAKVGRQEILELIFEPGFSTAAQVTDLSGRGVGMDVVRSNLKQVNGNVSIATEQGKGTTFTITVPISLSIIRVLLVESNGMLMGFPTSVVEEMLLLNPAGQLSANNSDLDHQLLEWEGFSVPIVPLSQFLQFSRLHRPPDAEVSPVINESVLLIVGKDNQPYAIQCDRYWGEQEVATRLVEGMAMPQGFSGCAILGGGRVVPLVDVERLLELALNPRSVDPLENLPINIPEQAKNILIIDDSINVRRFLALTLEKSGYQVEQAKDGQEALEKLQSNQMSRIAAIICDIEMPRLDGFGFLAQSQAEDKFKHIPVLMLTSRNSNKHRQLAMNLGATGYFSKPFKESELLGTLAQLTSEASDLSVNQPLSLAYV